MRFLIAAALGLIALTSAANASEREHRECFSSTNWEGWSAPGDGDALLLRVRSHEIYRAELNRGAHVRKYSDQFLVNRQFGSSQICSPLDLNLTLADHHGFRRPLIVRSLHRLTDEEIAAIPEHDRP